MQVSIKDYPAKYGTTDEAVRAEFAGRIVGSFAELTAWTVKDASYIDAVLSERAQAKARTTSEPTATERQISYIRSLIARGAHIEGGYLTISSATDLSKLTRRQASAMIDSLTSRY